jgi:hypothetical protein
VRGREEWFLILFIYFLAQTEIITIITNTTSPDVTVTSPVLGNQSFSISLISIFETDSDETVRSIAISGVNFSLEESTSGNNTLYNYSAVLDNEATIYVLVSLTLPLSLLSPLLSILSPLFKSHTLKNHSYGNSRKTQPW